MRPGDLVRLLPAYTPVRPPPIGIILDVADVHIGIDITKLNVLFPDGIHMVYGYEIEVIVEDR